MLYSIRTIFVLVFAIILASNQSFSALSKKNNAIINDKILAKNKYINQDVSQEIILPRIIQVKFKQEVFSTNSYLKVTNIIKNYIDIKSINEFSFPFKPKYNNQLLSAESKYGIDRISTIYFNSDIDPTELAIQLMNDDMVEYATPVYRRKLYI